MLGDITLQRVKWPKNKCTLHHHGQIQNVSKTKITKYIIYLLFQEHGEKWLWDEKCILAFGWWLESKGIECIICASCRLYTTHSHATKRGWVTSSFYICEPSVSDLTHQIQIHPQLPYPCAALIIASFSFSFFAIWPGLALIWKQKRRAINNKKHIMIRTCLLSILLMPVV